MGRKAKNINSESSKRLCQWLDEIGMTQTELAEKIGYTQQYVSLVATGKKPLTIDMAQLISDRAQKYVRTVGSDDSGAPLWEGSEAVRVNWLLGLDDDETENDRIFNSHESKNKIVDGIWGIFETSLRKYGKSLKFIHREGDHPDYASRMSSGCHYEITDMKSGEVLKSFGPDEMTELEMKLQKYSDFIMWEYMQ